MADYFGRPLRLTRSEALAIYLRGTALAGAPGLEEAPALSSALGKLADALGPEALGACPIGWFDPGRTDARHARRAPPSGLVVSGSGSSTTRPRGPRRPSVRSTPGGLLRIGNWYVAAWDHRSNSERLFRADRIHAAAATGERFEPRDSRAPADPCTRPPRTTFA